MLSIYLHHVRRDIGAQEAPIYQAPQQEDLKRRRRNMGSHRLPHLAAELDGTVIGYVYAAPFSKHWPTAMSSSTRSTLTLTISIGAWGAM